MSGRTPQPFIDDLLERIDIVDVFRRPEHVAVIADDCIRLKLPVLWLQDGVIDPAAATRAAAASSPFNRATARLTSPSAAPSSPANAFALCRKGA